MASEDVNTALSLMRFVKEFWGVIIGLLLAGGLYMKFKYEKKRINERLDGHDQKFSNNGEEINDLKKSIQFIRENWVTEDKLDNKLKDLSTNVANAVLVAINKTEKWDGEDRRSRQR